MIYMVNLGNLHRPDCCGGFMQFFPILSEPKESACLLQSFGTLAVRL